MSDSVKFRAECVKDVILWVHQLSHSERASIELTPLPGLPPGLPDVEVTLTLDRNTIADLRRYMATVEDGHVMVESLKPLAEYDGERDAFEREIMKSLGPPRLISTPHSIDMGKQARQIEQLLSQLDQGHTVRFVTKHITRFALDFAFQTGYELEHEALESPGHYNLKLGKERGEPFRLEGIVAPRNSTGE